MPLDVSAEITIGLKRENVMALPEPYFKTANRKEVFGQGDTGTNTVIQLIRIKEDSYEMLKPDATAPVAEKSEYTNLVKILEKNTSFVTTPIDGYYEYNAELTENEAKALLEAEGFNEYD